MFSTKGPIEESIGMSVKNCVYRFVDASDDVIYVGKTKDLQLRLNQHRNEPHLDKKVYSEIRRIDYISFPSYMDVGIMERAFIAWFKPRYNTQYTSEGTVSVIQDDQLRSYRWITVENLADGIHIPEKQRTRMGSLDRADYCVIDNEGMSTEMFFLR